MLNYCKFFLIDILRQNFSKNETRQILNYIKSLCTKLFWVFWNKMSEQPRPEKFWTRSSFYVLKFFKYFGAKCHKKQTRNTLSYRCQVLMCWIILNTLRRIVSKNQTRKQYQVFMFNFKNDQRVKKIFELYKVFEAKCLNTSTLYTLKALLNKNRFYCFLVIFWHAKIPPFLRISRYWY